LREPVICNGNIKETDLYTDLYSDLYDVRDRMAKEEILKEVGVLTAGHRIRLDHRDV